MKHWKVLKSLLVLDNKWFKIRQDRVQLSNGKILDNYFVWENTDVSLIVPVTKEGKFVLVQQYRHGAKQLTIEFPVGYIEKNESPKQAARRELQEETGYNSKSFIQLAKFTNNASKETGNIYIFLAKNVLNSRGLLFDENEDIKTIILTPNEVMTMILKGDLRISCSVAAAFLAFQKLGILTHE